MKRGPGVLFEIADGKLSVSVPITAAEAKHIQAQAHEIYMRGAVRHLVGKKLMEGMNQPSAEEVAKADGRWAYGKESARVAIEAKVGRGPKLTGTKVGRQANG